MKFCVFLAPLPIVKGAKLKGLMITIFLLGTFSLLFGQTGSINAISPFYHFFLPLDSTTI